MQRSLLGYKGTSCDKILRNSLANTPFRKAHVSKLESEAESSRL